jgi:hypothetical protein
MPFTIFTVIPDVVHGEPGDIVLRTFANHSVVSNLTRLIEDEDIILAPAFNNVSTFGNHRLSFGDELDIVLETAFANSSTFGAATELTVAPPDEVILLDEAFQNVSTFGETTELTVAPPDEVILMDTFTNVSIFGTEIYLIPAEFGEDEDYDAVADYQPIGRIPN